MGDADGFSLVYYPSMDKKNRQHKRRFGWRQDYNVGVTLCNKISITPAHKENNDSMQQKN